MTLCLIDDVTLPPSFEDLEPLVAFWARQGSQARLERRFASSADERRSFYQTMAMRADAIADYLNQKIMAKLSAQETRLFQLLLVLAEISLTEEVNGQEVEAIHQSNNRLIRFQKEIDGR